MTEFDLRTATILRQEGMSAQAIAEKLAANSTAVSASTVRRKLIDNDTWRFPSDGKLFRHRIRVCGLVRKGFGYAAFRRSTFRVEGGEWRPGGSLPRTVAVRWPACERTNALTSAAMAALAGLIHVPDEEPVAIQAADDILLLLSELASAPASPSLPEAAALLDPALPGLRRATLQPGRPSHYLKVVPQKANNLTPVWVTSRLRSTSQSVTTRAAAARNTPCKIPSHGPAVGSWISDYNQASGSTEGVAAFYRLTPFPLSCTPVFTMRLHVTKTVEGELIAALMAYIYARITGETNPVVHSDCQGATGYLRRDLDQITGSHASLYRTVLSCLPVSEVHALDMRWTSRTDDTIVHADSAARALLHPNRETARLTKARKLAITIQPSQIIDAARAFYEKGQDQT
ncbi:hypothetical protein ABZS76_32740 [Streptomyces sp. NPDC005562]|uniref:hypothetical protein n=1 Tax=Streptomyces sp. NPDC005562 TaxID=3154890 RepID=UPI0033B2B090